MKGSLVNKRPTPQSQEGFESLVAGQASSEIASSVARGANALIQGSTDVLEESECKSDTVATTM